tara:strand:- start:83 stop:1060 length:978 start_codon:yes stop_codon:yes gene_type:complete
MARDRYPFNKKNKPTYRPKVKSQSGVTGDNEFVYDQNHPDSNFVRTGEKYFELSNGSYYLGKNINELGRRIYKSRPEKKDNTYIINNPVPDPNYIYGVRQKRIHKFQDNLEPIYSSKSFPTEEDYEKGFYHRYISLRKNSPGDIKEINKEIYDDIVKKEGRYDYNMYNVAKLKWSLLDGNTRNNQLQLRQLKQKGFINVGMLFPNLNEFYLPSKALQPKSLEEELDNPKLVSNPKLESQIEEPNPKIAEIQQNVIDKIKDKTLKRKNRRTEKMLTKLRKQAKQNIANKRPSLKKQNESIGGNNMGSSMGGGTTGGGTSGGGGGGY